MLTSDREVNITVWLTSFPFDLEWKVKDVDLFFGWCWLSTGTRRINIPGRCRAGHVDDQWRVRNSHFPSEYEQFRFLNRLRFQKQWKYNWNIKISVSLAMRCLANSDGRVGRRNRGSKSITIPCRKWTSEVVASTGCAKMVAILEGILAFLEMLRRHGSINPNIPLDVSQEMTPLKC